ncbi:hypothetical protein [Trichothermofontia sp.]
MNLRLLAGAAKRLGKAKVATAVGEESRNESITHRAWNGRLGYRQAGCLDPHCFLIFKQQITGNVWDSASWGGK